MYIEQTVHFYLPYLRRENIPSHIDCHHHHHLFLRGSKMSQSFSNANLHCFLSFSFHKDSECSSDPRSWWNFKLCVMSPEVYRCEWNQFGSRFLFPHLEPQILQHWKDVLIIVSTLLGDPENLLPQNLMVTLDLLLYDIGWPNNILINQPFSISQPWNKTWLPYLSFQFGTSPWLLCGSWEFAGKHLSLESVYMGGLWHSKVNAQCLSPFGAAH